MIRLALLVCLSATAASAQVSIGVRAGVNVASLYGFETFTFGRGNRSEVVMGLTGGVFADVPVAPFVALRPELLYSQKGLGISTYETLASADGQFRSVQAFTSLRADYVEAPLLVRVSVPIRPMLRVGVMTGPSFAFKVRESVSEASRLDGGGIIPTDVFPDRNGGDAFEALDVGGVLGAEVGSGPFALDLRYTVGFLGVASASPDFPDDDIQTVRNGVLAVAASYRLGP